MHGPCMYACIYALTWYASQSAMYIGIGKLSKQFGKLWEAGALRNYRDCGCW